MTESTWDSHPESNEWNLKQNWSGEAEPAMLAVFGSSLQTDILFAKGQQASVGAIHFSQDAVAYTFHFETSEQPLLTISGSGVTNDSERHQYFVVAATAESNNTIQLQFENSASAGDETIHYIAGPTYEAHYGGGVINFTNTANAGSANFVVWTGKGATPTWLAQQAAKTATTSTETPKPKKSTVGGEVSFSLNASAASANFVIYGSLGQDSDTFGNVVFHDTATAANATFTNVGGTIGDGGNTQFYGTSTAAHGMFYNKGATAANANGGDVAFDAQSSAAYGVFHNYAAPTAKGYGGVTSFNNNWPNVATGGAGAANAMLYNYGASAGQQGGGGHVEFSSRYGSPTGDNATINNYGSDIGTSKSCAGHTIFSLTISDQQDYYPDAKNAVIYNHGALAKDGAAGFTEFAMYSDSDDNSTAVTSTNIPTAGNATILNYGSMVDGGAGGYVSFSNTATAGKATLVAYSGEQGGYGGKIAFYDESTAQEATIKLNGTGSLDIAYHQGDLTIGSLYLSQGSIVLKPGQQVLHVSSDFYIDSRQTNFYFYAEAADVTGKTFTVLTSDQLSDYSKACFNANEIGGVKPSFSIEGTELKVSY